MFPDLRGLRLTKRQRRRFDETRQTYVDGYGEVDPPPRPPLRSFADLPDHPQEWLWPGRIPSGALTLLCGDQGRGKSLLALDVAARVSAGRPWPHGGVATPGDVLIFTAEDSLSRTVRNRLLAAGADLSRVHYIDTAHWSNGPYIPEDGPPERLVKSSFGQIPSPCWDSFYRDLYHLRGALMDLPECRLVIIDPFAAYLDLVDLYVDEPEEIRIALAPLTLMADTANVAVLAVVHRDGQQRLQSGLKRNGLRTLAGVARAAYLVDRIDAEPHASALIPVKNNLGDAATMAPFNVVAGPGGASQIEWSPGLLPLSAEHHAIGGPASRGAAPPPRRETQTEIAANWLERTLADGPLLSQQIDAKAAEAGINKRCLRRAKKSLGAMSSNFGHVGGPWVCTLPSYWDKVRGGQQNDVADMAHMATMADSPFPEDFPSIDPGESSTIPKPDAA